LNKKCFLIVDIHFYLFKVARGTRVFLLVVGQVEQAKIALEKWVSGNLRQSMSASMPVTK